MGFAYLRPKLLVLGGAPQPGGELKRQLLADAGHPEGWEEHLSTAHCPHLCSQFGELWINRYLDLKLRPT